MARINGEINPAQEDNLELNHEQIEQQADGVVEEVIAPVVQQEAHANVEEELAPAAQQQADNVAAEVIAPVVQQEAHVNVEEELAPAAQQQAGNVAEEEIVPVVQQEVVQQQIVDAVEEDALPAQDPINVVQHAEETEENEVLNQARQHQAAASEELHEEEFVVVNEETIAEDIELEAMHMPEPQQSNVAEGEASTEGHQELSTESFEARANDEQSTAAPAPTPAPQAEAASAPNKSKKCTIYSFMMAMMAHPAAKIAGVVLLSASLLALGLTTAGLMSFATSFIMMTALLGASMFAGHRYATKKPEPQEEPAPEATATAGM